MDSFAFIIHPIDPKRDVSRKFPFLGRILTAGQIDFFSTFFPPVYLSEIEGIRSEATGKEIKGWFIACPYTPRRMLSLPEKTVYRKIIQTGKMAEKLGAKMLGLGAFTSVVGDAGVSIAKGLDIPVTTGDAFTVAIAVEAIREAANLMGIDLAKATAAVVGAGGSIGRVCAEFLADDVQELYLLGRRPEPLEKLKEKLELSAFAKLHTGTDLSLLRDADLILTVTSAVHEEVLRPEHLRSGSVICDVARPRDVSAMVAAERDDILVIDGGMVDIPGAVDFHFDFGFPEGKAYACMAETMALALEGRFEDYTLGKDISRSRVEEIAAIAKKHGFRLSGFRSFEKEVTKAQIESVRRKAAKNFSERAAKA
ncbi:MAG: shikimate dehydrogenase [Anaerolineae bacterium]|jgi:fatty aldehyde-generating acyl-ACP reductase|nr:shikimate dehydrogenase [Anaerolineae bacterium]MBT7071240.1 shikimate dehydrogenase [Anaerolineae bacterium]MBT7324177.1 shikimate dehydrogenase [Anaerolineae bacterium]